MTRSGRRILLLLAALVGLLYAGRLVATRLADIWWARSVSPAAARFVTEWHLLRLGLEIAGIVVASAWFVAHLTVLIRAISSIQIPHRIADLEIREALTPKNLLVGTSVLGLLAGVAAGSGVSRWWRAILLSIVGVPYGESEPLLGRDLGVYVAQLPLWRLVHSYTVLLVLLALGGVLMLYIVIGSVRWVEGRPAVSDYARRHLGLLLAALAGTLVVGYLLEPYEIVAGLEHSPHDGLFRLHTIVAEILAGVALVTALLSAIWAWRPRHSLLVSAWGILILASIGGHYIAPALAAGDRPDDVSLDVRRRLNVLGYGLGALKDTVVPSGASGDVAFPAPAALWDSTLVLRTVAPDSERVIGASRTVVTVGGRPKPGWIAVRTEASRRPVLAVLLDDRAGALGGMLSYQEADTFPYPQAMTRLRLSSGAVWPGAPAYHLDTLPPGVPLGGWARRILLAWALQAGELLGSLPPSARIAWNRSPDQRLALLAPFAQWSHAEPRLIEGRLVWMADGYLYSTTFPISTRLTWRNSRVGSLQAAFVGVVEAEGGETRVFLRHTADPLAEAWSGLADGIVEPASAMPREYSAAVTYPIELFRVQARMLEDHTFKLGLVLGRSDSIPGEIPRPDEAWEPDTSRTCLRLAFVQPTEPRISALLEGRIVDGWETLRLVRLDSATSLPTPKLLQERWERFPPFTQIRDSVRQSGGTWVDGPVRYFPTPTRLGAYRTAFGLTPNGDPDLVWVNLAVGQRAGGGRNLGDAWKNLMGISVPMITILSPAAQLEEARHWVAVADSALRRGDLTGFSRAFERLRRLLGGPPLRHKF